MVIKIDGENNLLFIVTDSTQKEAEAEAEDAT